MNLNRLFFLIAFSLTMIGCGEETNNNVTTKKGTESPVQPQLELQVTHSFVTDTNEHFRGLEIKEGVAFIAGSQGSVLTLELAEGNLFKLTKLEGRHLRDIDILNTGDILTLAITEPAEIILIESLAGNPTPLLASPDSTAFLDGIDFWDDQLGLAFGDPLNNYPLIYRTVSGGKEWIRVPYEYLDSNWNKYAGFAASGTSIVCLDKGVGLIGLGNETGKILRTADFGYDWELIDIPFHQEPNGSGIYSMCFQNETNGVAVGGHWQNVTCDSSKIYTEDGGLSWHLSSGVQEYRSCVTYYKDDIYVSTGTTGTDISYDGGRSWTLLDTIGYNAIAFTTDGTGIGVGSYGKIDLIKLAENH